MIEMDRLGVITLGFAYALSTMSGSIALKEGLKELEGTLLVVAVIAILASLSTITIGSVYAFEELLKK